MLPLKPEKGKAMRSLLIAITMFASAAANAATVTIDFEALPLGGTPLQGGGVEVITDGYRFASQNGVTDGMSGTGKAIVGRSGVWEGDIGFISLSREDGGAFALYAADLLYAGDFIAASENGNFSSSSGPGLGQLGTGAWLNITSVVFFGAPVTFAPIVLDNVVVGSAVPVPAAAWLFGSALVGLGWLRRKQVT